MALRLQQPLKILNTPKEFKDITPAAEILS